MTLSELEALRRRAPFALALFCLLPWGWTVYEDPGGVGAGQLITPLLAFLGAFLYVGRNLRGGLWKRETDRHVGQLIRAELLQLIPEDLKISEEERAALSKWEIFKTLTGVFWEAVDRDQQLSSHRKHFYESGFVYTTSFDVHLIFGFAAYSYLAAHLFRRSEVFLLAAGVLLVTSLVSRWLVTPQARRRHLQLSREQLDLLVRNQSDFVSARFRDIITGWRAEESTPAVVGSSRGSVGARRISFWLVLFCSGVVFGLSMSGRISGPGPEPGPRRGVVRVGSAGVGKEVRWYDGSYALLIGVSEYSGGWSRLPSIPAELKEIESVLTEHEFEVTVVSNPDREGLENAFKAFMEEWGFEENNRLLFFYSGHGHTRTVRGEKKAYLVPVDAPDPRQAGDVEFVKSAVPMSDIRHWAQNYIEARHALFLFDSCFSGSILEMRALEAIPPPISADIAEPVRQFITAGKEDERVPARSDFARYFVDALRGAADSAPEPDGYVTGTELGQFLRGRLIAIGQQTPRYGKILDTELDDGDFVFRLPVEAAP